ncbi:MAG: lamin tail domain-containing protein, partial [Spartobacteria bacterium]|nr:lamin tail domain-containing protein [Spartobacteria bacterium]
SIFTDTVISNLIMSARSNAVWVTMPDSDNDRADDQTALYSERVGYLYVRDDDNEDIQFVDFRYSGKAVPTDGDMTNATFSITGLVQDASGIWGTADAARKPLFSLFSPTAQLIADQAMDGDAIADGEGTFALPAPISSPPTPVAYADNTLGIWTVRVTAVDADDDGWAGDSRQTVSDMAFEVADDDTEVPALSGIRLGSGGGGCATDLIFSEYIEVSTGDNKYLEIYNGMPTTADLSEYQIAKYFNGATAPSGVGNPINLAGTIEPGGVYVIANTTSTGWGGTPDKTDNLNFNGNDAVALLRNGATVDVLGVIGDADNWGNEVTMVRLVSVVNPSELWQTNDWTYYPPNTYDYLGSHVGPFSDGELAAATLTITGNVQDTHSGIYATGANQPTYSIYQPDGTPVAAAQTFSQAPVANGDAITLAPLSDDASGYFNYNNIVLGTHTIQVTAVDYDHDRADDCLGVTSAVPLHVVDDDIEPPLVGSGTPVNLLRNAGFEIEAGGADEAYYWTYDMPDKMGGTWNNHRRANWRASSGGWEGAIQGEWSAELTDSGGWYQLVTNAFGEGTLWQASGLFYADSDWTSAVSYLSIQFYDLDTNRIYGATNMFPHPGTAWTNVSLQATSPALCVYAKWEVGAWGISAFGALQFDDVELGPIISTPLAVQVGSMNALSEGSGTNAVFTVTDGDLAATQHANLLVNEGFEDGWDAWGSWGDVGQAGWAAGHGANGSYFRAWPDGDSPPFSGGLIQDMASPVIGEIYFFTIRGCREPNFWASEIHQKLEFLNSGYALVEAYTSTITADHVSGEWQTYTMSGVAPAGAAYARTTLLFNGATNDGPDASFLWDNAELCAGYSMAAPMRIRLGAYDLNSGLCRGADDPSTQMNLTVSHWITKNVENFSIMDSQTATTNVGAVSTWKWYSLDKGTISALYQAGSNAVRADLFDADHDRVADYLSRTNELFGYLRVIDDDTNSPTAQQLDINWSPANATNFVTDGSLRVGNYGIRITLEDQSGILTNYNEGWVPDFDLITPNGNIGLSSMPFEGFNSLSNNTVLETWKAWGGSVAYTNVTTGTWSVTWSAQDADNDRLDDRSYTSKSGVFSVWTNIFTVYDDDTTAPIAPSNLTASITWWTNVNNFSFIWDPAVDDSGIALDGYRVFTNATPTIDDGTPMVGISVTNILSDDLLNGGFEVGDGEGNEIVYDDTHTWWNRGSLGTRGRWSNARAQEGTNAMYLSCDVGARPNGTPRYSLIQTYTPINNTNNYPGQVTLSGYFYGDLSAGANGDFSCAFLKMEFCDANSNVIAMAVANEYDDGFNGRPGYGINTMGAWSPMSITATNMPANTKIILASVGLGHNQTYQSCDGYWDNISVEISLITPPGTFGAAYTNAPEGSNTVWLYVVDDDNDRPGDQLMSGVTNFTIMYDATPPAQIANVTANAGPDETTEVELLWDACANAGGADLSPWRSYRIYYTDEAREPTTNDLYFAAHNSGYTSLDTLTTDTAILSNFIFGMEYTFAVAGEDVAGNIGTLSDAVAHYFSGFFMTQGVVAASSGRIGWTAHDTAGVVDRPYDLIYQDARGFSTLSTSRWELLQTITNSYMVDDTVAAIPHGYTRFYRSAQADRWQTNRNPRLASAEIYGMKKLALYPGQNWVQIPFVPDTDTVEFVLGYGLPGGIIPATSTRVSWYEKTAEQIATNEIWFCADDNWYYSIGGAGYAHTKRIPLSEGFIVEIPTNEPAQSVWIIGRVPTNAPTRQQTLKGNAYNLIGYNMPRYTHPSEFSLEASGFRSSTFPFPWPGAMDTIMVWNNEQQTWRELWRDSAGQWRFTWPSPSFPLVPGNYLTPDSAILINRMGAIEDINWENNVIYPAPTREMNP